jgi:hypothetical protein
MRQNNNWLSGEVDYRNHHLQGVTWYVKGKSGSDNLVTLEKNGLVCDCKQFSFYSRCPHCVVVDNKIRGV